MKLLFKGVVSNKAENYWPRRFKEGHISQFCFSNYCTFLQGSNLPNTLNLLQEVKHDSDYNNTINIEWITNESSAEGWIFPMEIRISEYEIVKCIKVLKLPKIKMVIKNKVGKRCKKSSKVVNWNAKKTFLYIFRCGFFFGPSLGKLDVWVILYVYDSSRNKWSWYEENISTSNFGPLYHSYED